MERLYLTRPRRRRSFWGAYENTVVSRFLREIPSELLHGQSGSLRQKSVASGSMPSRFNDRMANFLAKQRQNCPKPKRLFWNRGGTKFASRFQSRDTGTSSRFGQREIQDVSGKPSNPRLLVSFQQAGRKSLLARYAKLEFSFDPTMQLSLHKRIW